MKYYRHRHTLGGDNLPDVDKCEVCDATVHRRSDFYSFMSTYIPDMCDTCDKISKGEVRRQPVPKVRRPWWLGIVRTLASI